MQVYNYPESNISIPNPLPVSSPTLLAAIEALGPYDVVDQIDNAVGPLMDVSANNIPASANLPLEIVASLAANVKKIKIVEDIGEFIGLYTGAASSEVLKAILPLGGGEVELEMAAGTRVSLRHMKNSDINTNTFIAINFLG